MLSGALGFIFFAVFASLFLESFWSNAITLINVILASLLAMSFFEPVAGLIDSQAPSFTYLWDYLALWLLFAIFYGILRLCTDFASRNRVKFRLPVEKVGQISCAALVAWVMVSFVLTSFHVAPLPAAPFNGGFCFSPEGRDFLTLSPDHYFLNFVQFTSRGPLARGPAAGAEKSPYPEDVGTNVFDPNSDFIPKYRQRRKNLESIPDSLRVAPQ